MRTNVGDDIDESFPNTKGDIGIGGGDIGGDDFSIGYGLTVNESGSSSVHNGNAPVQERATQMYLYFYVGETVQNANLIDAGRIGEQLANKQDKLSRYPIEISDKSLMPSWYVVYNDGWCEQGGTSANNGRKQITLLKNFVNTNYNVLGCCLSRNSSNIGGWFVVDTKTVSSFYATIGYASGSVSSNANYTYVWQASGYVN